MKIGLLNWSGNNNLGDDAMAMMIEKKVKELGHTPINMGEHIAPADAYIWGGGTLIDSSTGIFPKLPEDKPVVGFGLGVSQTPNPDSEFIIPIGIGPHKIKKSCNLWFDVIKPTLTQKNIVGMYMRDPFSYYWLKSRGIDCTLSHDPCLWFKLNKKKKRTFTAVNIITKWRGKSLLINGLDKVKNIKGFALSQQHDLQSLKELGIKGKYYDDPYELIDFLSGAKEAIATKLHAAVFCQVAEIPNIIAIPYAPKVTEFMEWCNLDKARKELDIHIKEAVCRLSQ